MKVSSSLLTFNSPSCSHRANLLHHQSPLSSSSSSSASDDQRVASAPPERKPAVFRRIVKNHWRHLAAKVEGTYYYARRICRSGWRRR
jgi:hypothetical protein